MGNRDSDETARYTANLVDTGVFRAVGKPPNEHYDQLKTAVIAADTTLHIPVTIYEELGRDTATDEFPSGSEYVDDAIRDDWVTVADPLPDSFTDDYDHATSPVERARHDCHQYPAGVGQISNAFMMLGNRQTIRNEPGVDLPVHAR